MNIIVVGLTLRNRTSNGAGKLQVGDFSWRCGVRSCVGDVAIVAVNGAGELRVGSVSGGSGAVV